MSNIEYRITFTFAQCKMLRHLIGVTAQKERMERWGLTLEESKGVHELYNQLVRITDET